MTDLEMTRLCAEAMSSPEHGIMIIDGEEFEGTRERNIDLSSYDPLHDDAQAMALVEKLGLTIFLDDEIWQVFLPVSHSDPHMYVYSAENESLKMAVVECVAKARGQVK